MSDTSQYPKTNFQTERNDLGRPDQGAPRAGFADQAKELGRDLKQKASQLGDSVSQTARDQAAGLKDAAAGIGSKATDKVNNIISDQRSASADYVKGFAQAVHRAAGEFEQDIPQASRWIRGVAGQIDSVADAVREREPRELLNDVQHFARRQPALFFGGAMLLGFAALRFLKSGQNASGQGGQGV
jgi:hypothetical protein